MTLAVSLELKKSGIVAKAFMMKKILKLVIDFKSNIVFENYLKLKTHHQHHCVVNVW